MIKIFDIIAGSVDIFVGTTLSKHICTKRSDSPYFDPSWSSLEEFGSFEDFTAFYIKLDNTDSMLLYLDQPNIYI